MVKKIEKCREKADITNSILRDLPNWFGIEEAIVEYIEKVQNMPFWAVFEGNSAVGFIAVKEHFEKSAEIYVMGVLKEYHRCGYGKLLVEESEKYLKLNNFEFYQVKTLSDSHSDEGYAKTRQFYLSCGFLPFEEFKTLWGEANPALQMIKKI